VSQAKRGSLLFLVDSERKRGSTPLLPQPEGQLCSGGKVSLEVLGSIAIEDLRGKVLMDLSNPLDFDGGMPPTLSVCNTTSLGEQIQESFPELKVVKTLNTINAQLMVTPETLPEPTTIFVSGNDQEAKDFVIGEILQAAFGWRDIVDLGDITTARGTEMYLPLWIRMWGALGTAAFNIKIVREGGAAGPAR
jgi:hypothetical protein